MITINALGLQFSPLEGLVVLGESLVAGEDEDVSMEEGAEDQRVLIHFVDMITGPRRRRQGR